MERINLKRIASVLCVLMLSMGATTVMAQRAPDKSVSILQEVAKTIKAYPSVSIDFSLRVENNDEVTFSERGVLRVKQNKYYCAVGSTKMFCDGKTVWNYSSETNEVSISDFDPTDENIMNPLQLISDYAKNYSSKFIREEYKNGKQLYVIDLTPLKKATYYKVRLFLNKATKQVIRIVIYEREANTYYYEVNKCTTSVKLDDSLFVFDQTKYPNVEINDMR